MDHGRHCQCTFNRDGQDLLRVLATKAIMQETAITDTSPPVGQEGLGPRKPDSLEYQTEPSGFSEDSSSSWSPARAKGTEGWILC
jgi:hypothetical protein